jgi:hypothetical protein
MYYWVNGQGEGQQGIATTKEQAEANLKASLLSNWPDDPNPWDGWEWWQQPEKPNVWLFGVADQQPGRQISEGHIEKMPVSGGLWVLTCGQVPLGLFEDKDEMIGSALLTWPQMEVVMEDDHTVWFRYDFLHGQLVMPGEGVYKLTRD